MLGPVAVEHHDLYGLVDLTSAGVVMTAPSGPTRTAWLGATSTPRRTTDNRVG